jgi:hypothetical protein
MLRNNKQCLIITGLTPALRQAFTLIVKFERFIKHYIIVSRAKSRDNFETGNYFLHIGTYFLHYIASAQETCRK